MHKLNSVSPNHQILVIIFHPSGGNLEIVEIWPCCVGWTHVVKLIVLASQTVTLWFAFPEISYSLQWSVKLSVMDYSWNHTVSWKQESNKTCTKNFGICMCGRAKQVLHFSYSLKKMTFFLEQVVDLRRWWLFSKLHLKWFSESKWKFQILALQLLVFGVDSLSGHCALLDLTCLIIWPCRAEVTLQ